MRAAAVLVSGLLLALVTFDLVLARGLRVCVSFLHLDLLALLGLRGLALLSFDLARLMFALLLLSGDVALLQFRLVAGVFHLCALVQLCLTPLLGHRLLLRMFHLLALLTLRVFHLLALRELMLLADLDLAALVFRGCLVFGGLLALVLFGERLVSRVLGTLFGGMTLSFLVCLLGGDRLPLLFLLWVRLRSRLPVHDLLLLLLNGLRFRSPAPLQCFEFLFLTSGASSEALGTAGRGSIPRRLAECWSEARGGLRWGEPTRGFQRRWREAGRA